MKKLVKASGAENYNVLQNNGRIAHQEVDHVRICNCLYGLLWADLLLQVHFHMVSPATYRDVG